MKTGFSRRSLLALSLAAGVAAAFGSTSLRPAQAHEATCPVCKLDVVQDTPTQDNEVALKFGRKRIEYRCVWCAMSDAKTYKGDLTILAPSEIKGKPVLISRKGGQWLTAPEGSVFVAQKADHKHCQTTYRAFTTKAAFEAHVKKNAALLADAKPLTLPQMVELAK